MSTDASAAATGRPEPSGGTGARRRDGGAAVPPPRSAPENEPAPAGQPPPATDSAPVIAPGHGTEPDHVTEPGQGTEPAQGAEPGHGTEPGQRAAPGGTTGLTERERAILAFEQQWWRHAGAKEQAIRDTFGLSATRYYQLLNGLLDNPAALAAEPLLIGRLRRLRSSRARNRRR
ncbi:DUF3263 domain-containing protein [Micromonospora sp. NPDC050686]|uniref:DUF3263 domain-containing protein n=1 Tax=Micromonospora sp. NPDC050686 TaxID=3154631 RepID=UPI0033CDC286